MNESQEFCNKQYGVRIWYKDGLRHRIGAPAIIWPKHIAKVTNRKYTWCIDGIEILSEKHYQELTGCSDEDLMFLILKYGNM